MKFTLTQQGFRCNKPATDEVFCIHQLLKKKQECNGPTQGIFKESDKAYDSIRREVQGKCTGEHRCAKPSSYFQYGLTLVGW